MRSAASTEPPDKRERIGEARHGEREVLGRPEAERSIGQPAGEQRDAHDAERARHERAHGGDRERGAGSSLARHLIAVDGRHDRGRLARHVHEDRRRGAAIHRAVVDAGEHDQRRRGRQGEGRGQQQRHRADRSDAGQHADDRCRSGPCEAGQEVGRGRARRRGRRSGRRSVPSSRRQASAEEDARGASGTPRGARRRRSTTGRRPATAATSAPGQPAPPEAVAGAVRRTRTLRPDSPSMAAAGRSRPARPR